MTTDAKTAREATARLVLASKEFLDAFVCWEAATHLEFGRDSPRSLRGPATAAAGGAASLNGTPPPPAASWSTPAAAAPQGRDRGLARLCRSDLVVAWRRLVEQRCSLFQCGLPAFSRSRWIA